MTKKELLQKAFKGEAVPYVPFGSWFHFTEDELVDGLAVPDMIERNIAGHKKFFDEVSPDFVKIMSDGFFIYPNEVFCNAKSAKELWQVSSIGENHPWIEKQVELVRTVIKYISDKNLHCRAAADFCSPEELRSGFNTPCPAAEPRTLNKACAEDIKPYEANNASASSGCPPCYYNIFSPATTFKFVRIKKMGQCEKLLADFILEDQAAVKYAFNVLANDLSFLVKKIASIKIPAAEKAVGELQSHECDCDGIYFSTQNICDPRITSAMFDDVVASSDKIVLNAVKDRSNILHICGYEGHKNNLGDFVDYPAAAINWASCFEGISLKKGRDIFKGKTVLGGFDNTVKGVLYKGNRNEIEAETARLLEDFGSTKNLILGADCTLPRDISIEHIKWVKDYLKRI
ncbi:MAG: uroporphyrinogen decarboxylase family protein [Termitinemataceae bacterium]|nr:MAG: uroporphyrinogen decarboxylase family protein [Termitinemataceae bacterium]